MHWYVIRMSLVIFLGYVTLCHSYAFACHLYVLVCHSYVTRPLAETHLDAVRGLIQLRGFNQCLNKKSSSEQCCYIRSEQTDLLKYFAKD